MSLARHLNFQGCIKGQLNPLQLKGIQKLSELKHSQSNTNMFMCVESSQTSQKRHLGLRIISQIVGSWNSLLTLKYKVVITWKVS